MLLKELATNMMAIRQEWRQHNYIDHNSHINRPQFTNKEGKKVFTRKWSKRSTRWHDVPMPSPKTYPYAAGNDY